MSTGLIILISAVIVVLTASLLKRVSMSTQVKDAIATVVSLVVGVAAAIIEAGSIADLTAGGLVGTLLIIYGSKELIYKYVSKPSGLDELLETKVNG